MPTVLSPSTSGLAKIGAAWDGFLQPESGTHMTAEGESISPYITIDHGIHDPCLTKGSSMQHKPSEVCGYDFGLGHCTSEGRGAEERRSPQLGGRVAT